MIQLMPRLPEIITQGEKIKIARMKGITYSEGLPNHASLKNYEAIASVQPLSGKELLMLEEGERQRERFNVFTEFKLENSDVITREGKKYEVQKVDAWGRYTKAMMALKDV